MTTTIKIKGDIDMNKTIKLIEGKYNKYYSMFKEELKKNENEINFEKVDHLKEIISLLQDIYFAILRSE